MNLASKAFAVQFWSPSLVCYPQVSFETGLVLSAVVQFSNLLLVLVLVIFIHASLRGLQDIIYKLEAWL